MNKLQIQKRVGLNPNYKPDFHAWPEHDEDHVAEQFKNLWSQIWLVLQYCICGGVVGVVFTLWLFGV